MQTVYLTGTLVGCDTATAIGSLAEANCLWGATPYDFIGRYISNSSTESSGDLSSTELSNLVNAVWKVAIIQHALAGGTTLTASMGTTYGNNAVNNAKSIGVPRAAALWLDIENFNTTYSDPMGFCKNWSAAVMADGTYVPALYYGAPGLSATQVNLLMTGGYFSDAWAGCGQATGIGESIDQGPCLTTMSANCGTAYSVSIDEDTILSGKTVAFVGA